MESVFFFLLLKFQICYGIDLVIKYLFHRIYKFTKIMKRQCRLYEIHNNIKHFTFSANFEREITADFVSKQTLPDITKDGGKGTRIALYLPLLLKIPLSEQSSAEDHGARI